MKIAHSDIGALTYYQLRPDSPNYPSFRQGIFVNGVYMVPNDYLPVLLTPLRYARRGGISLDANAFDFTLVAITLHFQATTT